MRNRWLLFFWCGLAVIASSVSSSVMASDLSLSSPAIKPGSAIEKKFTCDGAGLSPTLMIQGVPKAAKSLVIEVLDPDAPKGTFVHWGLYNLAPNIAFLGAGASRHDLPGPAASLTNGFGKSGYGAICPPKGQMHHYHFILYALDTRVSQQPKNRAALQAAIKHHILAKTEFTAHYARHD